VADVDEVVDGQFAPRLDADAGAGRIVVAERDEGFRLAAQDRARHRLVLSVENLDDRIKLRAESAGLDFKHKALTLVGCEFPEMELPVLAQLAVGCPWDRNRCFDLVSFFLAGKHIWELANDYHGVAKRLALRRVVEDGHLGANRLFRVDLGCKLVQVEMDAAEANDPARAALHAERKD